MDSAVSLHRICGAAMSDITEYLREQRENGVFYSWPDFWHVFGNKHPLLNKESHINSYRTSTGFSEASCFYCFLEERAGEMLIGNDGVTFIRIPDEQT